LIIIYYRQEDFSESTIADMAGFHDMAFWDKYVKKFIPLMFG
jgi:hypothetical protein